MTDSKLWANLSKFGQSAAQLGQSAAQKAAEKAYIFAESVTAQSKIHLDYEFGPEVGQAGPDGVFKIHRGRPHKGGAYKAVSIWIANKAAFQQPPPITSKSATALLETDIRQTNLLKHPGVVRIIESLEETRTQYILVTEEVIGSLDSWLHGRCRLQSESNDTEPLSELELKHGLQKVAETLSFLHGSCKRVHCNLCLQSIILAADGTWKLAGLGLSQAASDDELPGLTGEQQERYSHDHTVAAPADRLAKPDLHYSAPELVDSVSEAPISGAADVFSLACVAYRLLRKQPLFTAQTTSEYRGTLASMNLLPVDGLPASLQALLRSMLSQTASQRPLIQTFLEASYFRDDRILRALRFLDTILQRETAQKHAFMRDLPTFLSQIPARVLRQRVLPILLQQWQDDSLRDAVLPLILRMVKSLPADIFQDQVLPELRRILETAGGAQMIAVLQAVPDLQAAMRIEQVEEVLMPMLLKGLAGADTRIQEEVLSALVEPLKRVRAQCIHDRVLPVMLKTCVETKSASVRTAVLQTLAGVAPRLTEQESDVCARMMKQLTSVEASDNTLLHVLHVCEAIGESKSAAYGARTLVPLLTPLLVASAMTSPTFSRYMVFLRSMLDKIEQRMHSQKASLRGASTNGTAPAAWDDPPPPASGSSTPSTASYANLGNAMNAGQSGHSQGRAQGLGLSSDDFLSDWSSPVASTNAPSTASATSSGAQQPHVAAGLGGTPMGMRPSSHTTSGVVSVASAFSGLRIGHSSQQSTGLLGSSTGKSMGATQGLGSLAGGGLAPLGPTPGVSDGSGLRAGMSGVIGGTQQSVMASAAAATPAHGAHGDPFADLLSGPAPAAKPNAGPQKGTWDPFA